jgi:broad specificity phosphatase PhoE
MDLLLIRHAEPRRIAESVGPADPGLTEQGRMQADRLAAWLSTETIDAVWASPLRRAVETAAPLARALGVPLIEDDGLCEWDRHTNSYIPMEELRATKGPEWDALIAGRLDLLAGVDPIVFRDGVVACMERIITASPAQRVAVVCHGGVVNAYLGHVLGVMRPLWFDPGYTSISRVAASRDGVRSIVSINELPHLHPSAR